MNLRVIEGGLGRAAGKLAGGRMPAPLDVMREAERRLGESGYQLARAKSLATGIQMPALLRYLQMQLDFAADMLSRLDPIPGDFREDRYWPSFDGSR